MFAGILAMPLSNFGKTNGGKTSEIESFAKLENIQENYLVYVDWLYPSSFTNSRIQYRCFPINFVREIDQTKF